MIAFLRGIGVLTPQSKEVRVRIGRLLYVPIALVLFDGATPLYAALGDAPRCLPSGAVSATGINANPPIPLLRRVLPSFDSEDRDYLIRTIAFEASGEPEEGKAAVAHVILNRERSGRWGGTIKDVVTHPWQFEPWMTRRSEMLRLSVEDPRYRSAAEIADAVLAGETPDPTAGATHFLNPTIVRQRRGGSLPAWAQGDGQPIGRHTFYSPNEADAAIPVLSVSLGLVADAASGPTAADSGDGSTLRARQILTGEHAGDACVGHELTARGLDLPPGNLVQLEAR
jgi:hypothetical protein